MAWDRMHEITKKFKAEEIRLLCAADRVPGRIEELNDMRQVFIKLVYERKYIPSQLKKIWRLFPKIGGCSQ